MTRLNLKIGGEAGFGIMVAGLTFSKTLCRAGYHIVETNEYPSLIRGGHNTVAITFSDEILTAPYKPVDLLIALNKESILYHLDELSANAGVLFDGENVSLEGLTIPVGVATYSVPLMRLSKEAGGNLLMRNTVALGASTAILNLPFESLAEVLTEQFKKKGDAVVNFNVNTAKAGFEFVEKNFPNRQKFGITKKEAERKMVVTGADSVALGAISAGMKFITAYPMTPINSILAFMATVQEKIGIVYKQPEDEIAGINMAIGASFAGVRAMVATSGGGFSLMVEGTSLAGMIEQPLVIIMGMRPGPATGLPTWTGQADLHFVLNAGQGEFPRLVVAPGDAQEAYYLTAEAFNLADKYQTPTFVLVDKYLCETRFSTELFDPDKISIKRGKLLTEEEQGKTADFPRFQITDDGISPRGIPGRKSGVFRVNSDEHDEHGYSDEEAENTLNMISKRMKKQEVADKEVPAPTLYGPSEADVTLVGWGSSKGAIQEALKQCNNLPAGKASETMKQFKINFLHLNYINPFPTDAVLETLTKAKKVIDVEGNHNAQMAQYIRMKTGFEIKDKILKYDGRPFYPEDIIEKVKILAT